MIRRALLVALIFSWLGVLAGVAQAAAPSRTSDASETVSAGSIGLRGGLDSNPTDTPEARAARSETAQAASAETAQPAPAETAQPAASKTAQPAPARTTQTAPVETPQAAPAETPQAGPAAAPAETPQAAQAETVSAGSIGLRTGYDSNPTDTLGARGSLFATQTINYDYLRGSLQEGIGFTLKVADTLYDPNVAASATNIVAAVTGAVRLAPNLSLRTTLTTTIDDNWARRSHAVQLRNRIEYETTEFRVFTNLDTGLSALNERDIFTEGAFLPLDENFATTTIMPGFAYKFGVGEIGASVALSRVAYFAPDIFGLDHSHDIVQPNAFFTAKVSGIELEGSLSPFLATYDTTDFDTVRQLLYTAKARYPTGSWTFGLGSSRTMQDTTLPFASLDAALAHEASVSYKFDDSNAVSLLARYRRDDYLGVADYLGVDLWSTTFLTGIDFAHDFGDGFIGTAGVSVRQVRRPDEIQPWALNLQVGLQKKLDFGGPPKSAPDKAVDARRTTGL
jgi:hypothetical protein